MGLPVRNNLDVPFSPPLGWRTGTFILRHVSSGVWAVVRYIDRASPPLFRLQCLGRDVLPGSYRAFFLGWAFLLLLP